MGNDTLTGGGGNDVLDDLDGDNLLTGGEGADTFYVLRKLDITVGGSTSKSTIKDFEPGIDKIQLRSFGSYFDFVLGTSARSGYEYETIIYDRNTGNLFYDGDGRGGEYSPHLFANLETKPALLFTDFSIVY